MKFIDQTAKTDWKFLVIVAFVAVFLTGGILMLVPRFEEQLQPLLPSVISSPNGNGNNNQILDTSSWQTYRNEEFGFEVKYPKDWKTREHSIDSRHKDFLKTFDEYDCIFTIYNTEDKDSYEASFQSIKTQGYYEEEKEEIFINHTLATKLSHPKFPEKADYFLKKEKNGKELYFHVFYSAFQITKATTIIVTDHECGGIFNQMLTTFRFLK